MSGVIAGIDLFIWGVTGAGYWPFWPLLGLGAALAIHAIVTHQWARLHPGARAGAVQRVDVLTRTRRGALDVAGGASCAGSSATCTTARRPGWSR